MTFERAMVILFTKVAQTVIAERFTHTFFLIMMETECERYLHIYLVFL